MANRKPVIFFLSKSGGGKDTQADLLLAKYKFDYINTGDLFRDLISDASMNSFAKDSAEYYEAAELRKLVNNGKFAPSISVMYLWRPLLLRYVKNHDKSNGIILVGMARKLGEAMILQDFFTNFPDAAKYFRLTPVLLKTTNREVTRRLLLRRQCVDCRKPALMPVLDDESLVETCKRCAGKLIRRKDDNLAGITSRLREYKEHVVPVVKYFQQNKNLTIIDGNNSVEEIHRNIVKKLSL